jgi:methyl-accepting chemotaxis protein
MTGRLFSVVRAGVGRVALGRLMAIILVLGLVPAGVLGGLFVQQSLKDIRFAQKEIEGLVWLREAWPAVTMAADATDEASTRARAAQISARLEALPKAGQAITANAEVADLVRSLNATARSGRVDTLAPPRALMTKVGDQSNLILDPDLDSFYLMDVVLLKLTDMVEATEHARHTGDQGERAAAAAAIVRAARATSISIDRAIEGNGDGALAATALRSQARKLLGMAKQRAEILRADGTSAAGIAELAAARDLLWKNAAANLDRLLSVRVDALSQRLQVSVLASIAIAAIVVLLAALLIGMLSRGLAELTGRIQMLADGDASSAVPGTELQNEIGIFARALESFVVLESEREALARALAKAREESEQLLQATVERVKGENSVLMQREAVQQALRQDAERQAIVGLARDLEARVSHLLAATRAAAGRMDEAAGSMADVAGATFHHADTANAAADRIRDTVTEAAPRVATIADQLRKLRTQSDEGRAVASAALSHADAASSRMAAFAQAADRIDTMQSLIASVARQTNLLALNAAIEATRVGEAGAGFMIVADEVKALAQSTRSATQDIADQIADMRSANGAVVEAFDAIFDAMARLSAATLSISDGINEQTNDIVAVEHSIVTASDTVVSMATGIAGASNAARLARDTSGGIAETCGDVVGQLATLDTTIAEFTEGLMHAQR